MYAYVGNDPVNASDPTGLLGLDDDIVIRGSCKGVCIRGDSIGKFLDAHQSAFEGQDKEDPEGLEIVITAQKPEPKKKKQETRREKLVRKERERTTKNAYCSNLQYNAAVGGLLKGMLGSGLVGGGEAAYRYGTLRAAIRGAGRAVSGPAGLIVAVGLAVWDFNTGADGDPKCR